MLYFQYSVAFFMKMVFIITVYSASGLGDIKGHASLYYYYITYILGFNFFNCGCISGLKTVEVPELKRWRNKLHLDSRTFFFSFLI